jgi:hypothetical protein
MSERIVMIDLFEKERNLIPAIPPVIESAYTKKKVKTLPYMTEQELIDDRLRQPFYSLDAAIFHKDTFEKNMIKREKKACVNKHPQRITTLKDVLLSI